MKHNVGSTDVIIRLILSVMFFSLFFILEGNLKYLGLIGFIPLITAIFRTCPLYIILGIKTCTNRTK